MLTPTKTTSLPLFLIHYVFVWTGWVRALGSGSGGPSSGNTLLYVCVLKLRCIPWPSFLFPPHCHCIFPTNVYRATGDHSRCVFFISFLKFHLFPQARGFTSGPSTTFLTPIPARRGNLSTPHLKINPRKQSLRDHKHSHPLSTPGAEG